VMTSCMRPIRHYTIRLGIQRSPAGGASLGAQPWVPCDGGPTAITVQLGLDDGAYTIKQGQRVPSRQGRNSHQICCRAPFADAVQLAAFKTSPVARSTKLWAETRREFVAAA
jgi:hypothetical protein